MCVGVVNEAGWKAILAEIGLGRAFCAIPLSLYS